MHSIQANAQRTQPHARGMESGQGEGYPQGGYQQGYNQGGYQGYQQGHEQGGSNQGYASRGPGYDAPQGYQGDRASGPGGMSDMLNSQSGDFDPEEIARQIYPILAFRDRVVKAISSTIEKVYICPLEFYIPFPFRNQSSWTRFLEPLSLEPPLHNFYRDRFFSERSIRIGYFCCS